MAKSNPFAGMKAALRGQTKVTNVDRRSDFKVTAQGLDAIVANLMTGQRGIGSTVSAGNARTLQQMSKVRDTSNARLTNLVKGGKSTVANRYGSAIAANPELFRGTSALSKGAKNTNDASVSGASMLSRAGSEALTTIKQAGKTAASAAEFELAQALTYRAKEDAELLAANRLELQKMRLQTKLEWDMFKKQQEYQSKKLEKAQLQGLGLITDTAPGALFDLETALVQNDGKLEYTDPQTGEKVVMDLKTTAPGEVATYLMGQYGLPPEAMPVMVKAVTYMQKQGMDPAGALTSAITQLYGDVKGFEEATAGMDKTIALGVLASASTQRTADLAAAAGQSQNPFDLANPEGGFQRGLDRIASWFPGGSAAY